MRRLSCLVGGVSPRVSASLSTHGCNSPLAVTPLRRMNSYVGRVEGSIPFGGKGVAVGQVAEIERCFTAKDVQIFGEVIGDKNPLHESWTLGQDSPIPPDIQRLLKDHPLVQMNEKEGSSPSTKILVHGMLVASIFSSILGTIVPGSVYLQQSVEFRRPVYANEVVLGRITIEDIHIARRRKGLTLTCKTQVLRNGKECIRGQAHVWLLEGVSLKE